MFTLAKNWTEVCKSIIIWIRSVENEKKIYSELEQFDGSMVSTVDGANPQIVKLVRSLIK